MPAARHSASSDGGISAVTGLRLRSDDADDAKQVCLHRLLGKGLQRVPLKLESLNSNSAFIMPVPKMKKVYTYHGAKARRVEQADAEILAQKLLEFDLRNPSGKPITIREGDAPTREQLDFWGALKVGVDKRTGLPDTRSFRPSDSTRWLDLEPCTAYRLQPLWYKMGALGWSSIEESKCDKFVNKFPRAEFSSGAICLLACPQGELYLWIGEEAPKELREAGRQLANEHKAGCGKGATLIEVGPNRETVLFLERFRDWERSGAVAAHMRVFSGPHSPIAGSKIAHTSTENVRDLAKEVGRMNDDGCGTLAMVKHGYGDATRPGHKMSLVDDESGTLRVWRVSNRGNRALSPLPDDEVGVFLSGEAYVLLYSCKAGTKHMVWMWEGQDIPPTTKAAISMQTTNLMKSLGIQGHNDQVMVEQGREPSFMLALLSSRGKPALVVGGSYEGGCTQTRTAHAVFRVRESAAFPGRGCLLVGELHPKTVADTGLHPRHSYLVVQSLLAREGGARRPAVFIWHGSQATPAVRALADQLCAMPPRLYNAMAGQGGVSGNGLKMQPVVQPSKYRLDLAREAGMLCRPVRLFEVSNRKRTVGAMYVEEIGPGEVFLQEDLRHYECYLLDTGGSTLFVWHGPQAEDRTMMLASVIARSYVQACTTARPRLQHIWSGAEPLLFVASFAYWDTSKQGSRDANRLAFNPEEVTEKDVDYMAPVEAPRPYSERRAAELAPLQGQAEEEGWATWLWRRVVDS